MPQQTSVQQKTEPWTIRRILNWTVGYLERKGDEHPRLSAEWLLSNATGLTRVQLYMNFDQPLNKEELALMHDGVARRGNGEPLQYVTGEMPFRHIVLRCEKGVLIPRPETEILVDAALEGVDMATLTFPAVKEQVAAEPSPESNQAVTSEEKEQPSEEHTSSLASEEVDQPTKTVVVVPEGCRVLEIGTGTGCIALSLASERPGTRVVATDLSPDAIKLATRNRDALNLQHAVSIVECDLASGVDPKLMGTFSVLVSNPPYIPTDVLKNEVPAEVKDHEPELALDGGPDGLDVFRRILELAPAALAPGGMLCCELFEGHLDAAAGLVREQGGWKSVEVREDLTHRPRVLVAIHE
ncbi:MAG: N5-glutamine methyltransferase family protein [Tractidigestivibacter sp.]|uniref:N5-glutamine methyltransferase family protein n=1 Tax=Tractidigestivibacter sp. TaxID=2847320 RepID=UPI003D8C642E